MVSAMRRMLYGAAVFVIGTAAALLPSSTSSATTAELPDLGTPDHVGFVVADVASETTALTAATGTQFSPAVEETVFAVVGHHVEHVTLQTSTSLTGPLFVEVVHASKAVGPWKAGANPYVSYAVDDVFAYSLKFLHYNVTAAKEGKPLVKLVAWGDGFAFWQGLGGVTIRLIDADRAPSAGEQEQASGIDLGLPFGVTFNPCDRAALRDQLTALTGATFFPEAVYELPYTYPDGSVHLRTTHVSLSEQGPPRFGIEDGHGSPLEIPCSESTTQVNVVYIHSDIATVGDQFAAAGLEFVVGIQGYVNLSRTPGGVYVGVAHPVFAPPTS